jgi:hypothetical protein
MVAEVPVTPLAVTAPMVGIVARVEKLKFADVAVPPESVEITA